MTLRELLIYQHVGGAIKSALYCFILFGVACYANDIHLRLWWFPIVLGLTMAAEVTSAIRFISIIRKLRQEETL